MDTEDCYCSLSLPFEIYHKDYYTSKDYFDLERMIFTAKTFSDWAKVYRNLHWVIIKKNHYDLEYIRQLKTLSWKMIIVKAASKDDLMDELLDYSDRFLLNESNSLKESDLFEELEYILNPDPSDDGFSVDDFIEFENVYFDEEGNIHFNNEEEKDLWIEWTF